MISNWFVVWSVLHYGIVVLTLMCFTGSIVVVLMRMACISRLSEAQRMRMERVHVG